MRVRLNGACDGTFNFIIEAEAIDGAERYVLELLRKTAEAGGGRLECSAYFHGEHIEPTDLGPTECSLYFGSAVAEPAPVKECPSPAAVETRPCREAASRIVDAVLDHLRGRGGFDAVLEEMRTRRCGAIRFDLVALVERFVRGEL